MFMEHLSISSIQSYHSEILKLLNRRSSKLWTLRLEQKKEKTLAKRVAAKQAQWEGKARELASQKFACEADARSMLAELATKVRSQHFACTEEVRKEEVNTFRKKGRPKQGEEPQVTVSYRSICQIGELDAAVWEDMKRKESTFVLITNVQDKVAYEDSRILLEYKKQISVENRFRFLKSPVFLGPVFLKNQERIKALGYVFILGLLLACYLEYRVRGSLKANSQAVMLPGKKQTTTPSVATILEIFDTIQVVIVGGTRLFPDNINRQALAMIRWAGFNPDIYLRPLPV